MVNKLIKTKKDYSFALSRIDELMDAKAGTPEADELELLATLVEMYEDKHYPMDLPDPIEAIKFRMEQLGLNQQSLVPFIGSRSKVSEVLNRKRPLTLAMMRALHKSLGISSDVLLQEPGRDFPGDMTEIQWSNFPLSEMAKRGWIQKSNDLNGKAEEIVRDFIEQAGGPRVAIAALFRRSAGSRQNSKMDTYALCAWCLRVLSVARKNPLKSKFKDGSFNSQTLKEIAKLSYFQNGPSLAKEYLEKQGTHLIIIPHLSKTYLDGAAMLLNDGTPVVGLTLRYDRIDNFWFCLLHELAHVAKHVTRNPAHLNFLCTFCNPVATMVTVDMFKRLIARIAHAAKDLHRPVGRVAAQTVRLVVTHGDLVRNTERAVFIHLPRGLLDQRAEHFTCRLKFHKRKLDALIGR